MEWDQLRHWSFLSQNVERANQFHKNQTFTPEPKKKKLSPQGKLFRTKQKTFTCRLSYSITISLSCKKNSINNRALLFWLILARLTTANRRAAPKGCLHGVPLCAAPMGCLYGLSPLWAALWAATMSIYSNLAAMYTKRYQFVIPLTHTFCRNLVTTKANFSPVK